MWIVVLAIGLAVALLPAGGGRLGCGTSSSSTSDFARPCAVVVER
jgi:hypothetical protein